MRYCPAGAGGAKGCVPLQPYRFENNEEPEPSSVYGFSVAAVPKACTSWPGETGMMPAEQTTEFWLQSSALGRYLYLVPYSFRWVREANARLAQKKNKKKNKPSRFNAAPTRAFWDKHPGRGLAWISWHGRAAGRRVQPENGQPSSRLSAHPARFFMDTTPAHSGSSAITCTVSRAPWQAKPTPSLPAATGAWSRLKLPRGSTNPNGIVCITPGFISTASAQTKPRGKKRRRKNIEGDEKMKKII